MTGTWRARPWLLRLYASEPVEVHSKTRKALATAFCYDVFSEAAGDYRDSYFDGKEHFAAVTIFTA